MRSDIRLKSFVLTMFASCCWSQGLGTVGGNVTDPSGASIEGASVTVTEVGTKFSRTTTTGAEGYYVLNSLRPAEYTLAVEKAGFTRFTQSGITLLANQSLTLNLHLNVGSLSESVTVSADATQVDTTTQTIRQVVDSSRMIELPLNGRNAAQLTTLVAGAVVAPSNNADQGLTKTFPAAVTVSTNGSRENQVGYLLDGAPNLDIFTNVNQPFPFPDALQEFSVQTSNYNAEYGQNAGGVVSIVTKSGTNSFHGAAFGFLRNAVFNARNFFAVSRDPLKRGQFGGTLGGPIVRDRTFLFVGYQGTRIRSNQGGLKSFVPTDANLNGDFSAYLQGNNPNNPLGKAVTIKDPLAGQPFPGNLIPVSRFDPASVGMMKYIPRAGGNGAVFFTRPIRQNFDEYLLRGDHSLGNHDRLAARYFWDRYEGAPVFGGNLVAYRTGSTITSHNAVLQEIHIFGPALLNDFRFGFARVVSNRHPPADAPSVRDFGVQNIHQPKINAVKSVSVTGYFGVGDQPTAIMPREALSWTDDLRWVRGRHSIAFGGIIEHDRYDQTVNDGNSPGSFTFSGDTTSSALGDLMLGQLRTFTQGWLEQLKSRYFVVNVYAQDTFRVSRRLTLNYGLRYEPSQVWQDQFHQNKIFKASVFAQGVHSVVYSNAPAGLLFFGDPGVPEFGTTGDMMNFAPRVGFAYDVFGNGKTSLRGGGGVFYDSRIPGQSVTGQKQDAPWVASVSFTTPKGPFSNPYLGIVDPFPVVFPPPHDITFTLPVSARSWDPYSKFTSPTSYNWNVTVDQELQHDWLARVAYVASRSNHQQVTFDQNPAVYIPGSTLGVDQRRLYQGYSHIYQASQAGDSWYHSAQFTIQKRLSHGFTVMANYTFSKSLDNLPFNTDAATPGMSGWYTLPIYLPNSRMFDRGPSDYDHRHVLVVSYVWRLPSLPRVNRWVRGVAGNWQASGVVTAESGGPLTLYAGKDQSQTGTGSDRALMVSPQVYGGGACQSQSTCVNYLNSSAFILPPTGTFGNTGKGLLTGPGIWNWDMTISKLFPIHERYTVQFRAEFFNTFNRANFTNPVTTVSGAGFGSILGADAPRIMQLAMKFLF